jgi:hypothetical protein
MEISDILIREAIVTDLKATTKESAFREHVSSVQDAGHLAEVDPVELVHALQWREELSSQLMNNVRTVTGKTGRGPHSGPYVTRNACATHRDQPAGAVMSARKRRPLTLFDLMILVAATAIGLSLVRFGWPRNFVANGVVLLAQHAGWAVAVSWLTLVLIGHWHPEHGILRSGFEGLVNIGHDATFRASWVVQAR